MLFDAQIHTSRRKVIAALVAGAAVGSIVTTIQYLIGLYQVNGAQHFAEFGFWKGAGVAIIAFLIWFFFIAICGGPVWYLLDRFRARSWLTAGISGAFVCFVCMLALLTGLFTGRSNGSFSAYSSGGWTWRNGFITSFGWERAFITSAEFGLVGAIIGLVVWAVAYRRGSGMDTTKGAEQ